METRGLRFTGKMWTQIPIIMAYYWGSGVPQFTMKMGNPLADLCCCIIEQVMHFHNVDVAMYTVHGQ